MFEFRPLTNKINFGNKMNSLLFSRIVYCLRFITTLQTYFLFLPVQGTLPLIFNIFNLSKNEREQKIEKDILKAMDTYEHMQRSIRLYSGSFLLHG